MSAAWRAGTITLVLMLCCAEASAAALQRVEFESAAQRRISGVFPGDRLQGDLAKPDGAGPFPAVVVLHGCAGMPEATKQGLADDLVAWGYVALFIDSYATRGIKHACTWAASAVSEKRRPDAYGALDFLGTQSFVDPFRVAAVGFSAGARVSLAVTEPHSFELWGSFGSALRFRAAAAFYPPCEAATVRPEMPTIIFIGAKDDWTPASDCSDKIASWGHDGPPIELVVYPGTSHGFYYVHLQPGMTVFDHWLEYNGAAADDATQRLRRFLDRTLK